MAVMANPVLEVAVALKGTGETTCAEAPGVPIVTPAQAGLVAPNKQNVNNAKRADRLVLVICEVKGRGEMLLKDTNSFIELLSIKIPEAHGSLMAEVEARLQPTWAE